MFDYFAENNSLVFPAHFGFPHGGYISRKGNGYDFKPLGQDINPA
jgi:hypothetical protein